MSKRQLGLDYLRGLVVAQVVAFHAVTPYAPLRLLAEDLHLVQDPHKSVAALLFIIASDVYFMSLLFFVSGLFVGPSLVARGAWGFARARFRRIGVPFVLALTLLMPPTYYAGVRAAGAKVDLLTFWAGYFFQPVWPLGPPWFLSTLLVFDLLAALLYRSAPAAIEALGRATSGAGRHPLRFCLALAACAAAAYLPLLMIFGFGWVAVGRVYIEASRQALYGTFFFAGVGVGAWGIERGLLGRESALVRRWPRWLSGGIAAQLFYMAVLFLVIPGLLQVSPGLTAVAFTVAFGLTCTATGLALLALFQRFARPNAILDSLGSNAFGIFVVHYFFVFWAQYLLLDWDAPGIVKGALVTLVALGLSWACSALAKRLPLAFERSSWAARRAAGS